MNSKKKIFPEKLFHPIENYQRVKSLVSFSLVVFLAFISCSDNHDLAGGSTTTDNGIRSGRVFNSYGNPYKNAELQFIPTEYHVNRDNDSLIIKDTTDDEGYFEITLPPDEDHNLLLLGKKEGIFIADFSKGSDSMITTDTLSELSVSINGSQKSKDWVIIGTPYQCEIQGDQCVFYDIAVGNYPRLEWEITLSITDLDIGANDLVVIDNIMPQKSVPIISQSLRPGQLTAYPHTDPIHSVTHGSEIWVGTQSTGIHYADNGGFNANYWAREELNNDAILRFDGWSEGGNQNLVLKTENHCYYFINSAFFEIGQTILSSRQGQKCLDVAMNPYGNIYASYKTGVEHTDGKGTWQASIDIDDISQMKSVNGAMYGWSDSGTLYNLDRQEPFILRSSTSPIIDLDYHDQKWILIQGDSIHIISDKNVHNQDHETISLPIPNTVFVSVSSLGELWGIIADGDIWRFDGHQVNYYETDPNIIKQEVTDYEWIQGDLYLANGSSELYKIKF